jgi:hypothetical protein
MLFSKSFGYAIRAIIYMAEKQQPGIYIKADEIAGELGIPRHFLSKVMKSMSKNEILHSSKGPAGGFATSEETYKMTLYKVAQVTKDVPEMNTCMLTFHPCDLKAPCALHLHMEKTNNDILGFLNSTTIADLIKKEDTAVGRLLSTLNPNPLPKTSAA